MKKGIIALWLLLSAGFLYGQEIVGKWELQSVVLKKVEYNNNDTIAIQYDSTMFDSLTSGIFGTIEIKSNGTCLIESDIKGSYAYEDNSIVIDILPVPHSYSIITLGPNSLKVSKEFWASDKDYIPYHYTAICTFKKL